MARIIVVPKWVVVQHSAMGYNGDTTFARGLETRMIDTKRDHDLVEKIGGITFDNYSDAESWAHSAMYPEGTLGMVPQAQGKFSESKIDGLRIYIPVREVVG